MNRFIQKCPIEYVLALALVIGTIYYYLGNVSYELNAGLYGEIAVMLGIGVAGCFYASCKKVGFIVLSLALLFSMVPIMDPAWLMTLPTPPAFTMSRFLIIQSLQDLLRWPYLLAIILLIGVKIKGLAIRKTDIVFVTLSFVFAGLCLVASSYAPLLKWFAGICLYLTTAKSFAVLLYGTNNVKDEINGTEQK